jgi:mono/diheme cytochrome c family protein
MPTSAQVQIPAIETGLVWTFRLLSCNRRLPMITLNDAMKVISAAQKKASATFSITAGLALLVGASGAVAATEGWFTQAQATQGHQLFNNQCAECHRPDLTGAAGPPLVGPTFLAKWGNKPLSDLYQFEHKNMPATNPGSVPPDQLRAITAYILQKNGFLAGNSPLDKSESSRPLTKN